MLPTFKVTGYYKLLTLYRTLRVAKFAWYLTLEEVRGSPYIAEMINDLYQLLIEVEHTVNKTAFRDADRHIVPDSEMWQLCVVYAHSNNWSKLSLEQKQELVKNIHSPYIIEVETLAQFIAEVDALDEEQPQLDYQINIVYSDHFAKYIAYLPELDDCFAKGDSPEEALANVKIAKEKWIAQAKQDNRPIYKPYFSPSWHRYRFSDD